MHYPDNREFNEGFVDSDAEQDSSDSDCSRNAVSKFINANLAQASPEGETTTSKKKRKKKSKKKRDPEANIDNASGRSHVSLIGSVSPMKEYEELDPDSAFVAQVVNKLPAAARAKAEAQCDNSDKSKNTVSKMPKQSYVYGVEGYRKACQEQFEDAIDLCSKAINLEPSEFRFFGNRSFCYTKLHKYELAVKDADEAIRLNPKWPKGYYRKAEAFVGMKKYDEAEWLFKKVLALEPDCGDAHDELLNLQAIAIMEEYGFQHAVALAALHSHGTMEKALHYLLEQNFQKVSMHKQNQPLLSQSIENLQISPGPAMTVTTEKTDPRNPQGVVSLWVGNIAANLDEAAVKELFSKHGQVTSVRILPEKHCAFVNFEDKNGPGNAMKALQGKNVNGKCLFIKFPDKQRFDGQHNIILRKKVNNGSPHQGTPGEKDCMNWTQYGNCKWGDKCNFKHAKEKQGSYKN